MHMMTLEQFAELTRLSGFEGLSTSMDELVTHGVLVPVTREEGPGFYVLQLLLLERYAEIARVWAHLWHEHEVNPPDIEALTRDAAEMTQNLLGLFEQATHPPVPAMLRELLEMLEEHLEQHSPLGKLSSLVSCLNAEAIASTRGDLRRHLELWQAAQELRREITRLDSMRVTQDMPAPADLLASSAATSPHIKTPELTPGARANAMARPATVSTRVTAEMDAVEKPLEEPASQVTAEEREQPVSAEPEPAEREEESEHTSKETPVADAEEKREDAPVATDKPNPFVRDPSQSTTNTQDLQRRLEALRHLDGKPKVARAGSLAEKAIALSKAKDGEPEDKHDVPELPEEVEPDVDEEVVELEELEELELSDEEEISIELSQESPLVLDDDEMEDIFEEESRTMVLDSNELKSQALADARQAPAESDEEMSGVDEQEWQRQIQELNAKREAYMNEQNWTGLVQLYEEGVELFEGSERQQVYLTLAKLYELKIKDTSRALENMALAFEMGGEEAVLRKIIDALRRLGNGPTRQALMAWVEVQLGSGQWEFAITEALQRMRAGLLQETGDAQRGFLMYASFVADSPERAATDSGLDFLEGLAEGVDATELYELYDELIEQSLDHTLSYHLNSRAGFFALQREDMGQTVRYLERALELDPAQEQLFHVLSQLYEEDEHYSDLIVLHERRLKAVTGAAQEPLQAKLATLRQREATAREAYREAYAARLERTPQDDVLLECMMRSFIEEEKYIEGYAFLNRHLEKLTAVASRVRALQTLSTLALQHLDSPEEAHLHLDKALELGGARKKLLERLIMISLDIEEWGHVLRYIERLTGELSAEMTREEQVRWLLAGVQAAQSLSLIDKERSFLERTLEIMPDHEQARQALAEIS